jgi:superfamily II DNA/RNA helicase
MAQSARTATLEAFKAERVSLLVCSDVAARGLDVPDVSHVFNFDVPIHAEDYVHRIGRTGRAGRLGATFMLATAEEKKYVAAIEALIKQPIPSMTLDGFMPSHAAAVAAVAAGTEGDSSDGRRGGNRRPRTGGRNERHVAVRIDPTVAPQIIADALPVVQRAPEQTAASSRYEQRTERSERPSDRYQDRYDRQPRPRYGRGPSPADEVESLPESTVSFGDDIPAFLRRKIWA